MAQSKEPNIEAALEYLREGGLAEVFGMAMVAITEKYDKFLLDTDIALALCMLAQEAANQRTVH